jgi:hypothetical protein
MDAIFPRQMHTTKELDSTSFAYRGDGDEVSRETVTPSATGDGRIGVVMATGSDTDCCDWLLVRPPAFGRSIPN